MYFDFRAEIPKETGQIVRLKHRNGTTYINYEYDRIYDKDKHYSKPKRTTIGKQCEDNADQMYPNRRFYEFFPNVDMPDTVDSEPQRSRSIKIGTFMVIRKIIQDYSLDKTMRDLLGDDCGLFLDLAAYTIVSEDNAAQYYPAYAYEHPLMTTDMHPYSDSSICRFLKRVTTDQSEAFLDKWNASMDHRDKIYISYDSTNKDCSSGAIDIAEPGHPKDKSDKPIFNYSIAYDVKDRVPLIYEAYPGSIVDVSELTIMVQRVISYHYRSIGFIIDRGYFSEPNLNFLRKCGFSFIVMMKGMRALVKETVKKVKGTFEQKRECYISPFGDYGTTVEAKLYPADQVNSYLHIYYSTSKANAETQRINADVDSLEKWLKQHHGSVEDSFKLKGKALDYFELIWSDPDDNDDNKKADTGGDQKPDGKKVKSADGKEGSKQTKKKPRVLVLEKERTDVIDQELEMAGYFVLVTSEKMTAEKALMLYKSRDASEKLFRGDKSYLGDDSMRVYSENSVEAKIFIEFVALIIRNKMYTCLVDAKSESGSKAKYMTVPAAIAELEKISLIRASGDGDLGKPYYLGHALSATQKTILKAFGMDARYMEKNIMILGNELKKSDDKLKEGAEHEDTDDDSD